MALTDKLSIYPQQDKEVTAVETSTELERQVGQVRQALQRLSSNLFGSIRSGVDSVVRIEDKVEHRVNSLVAKDESVTPNGLYVGVLTLASMVFTRHRSFPVRWIVPPVVLFASMKYFLPGTTDNICDYYEKKEHEYSPSFSESRQASWNRVKRFWFTGLDHMQMTGNQINESWKTGLQGLENTTGLKVSSVLHNNEHGGGVPTNELKDEFGKKII